MSCEKRRIWHFRDPPSLTRFPPSNFSSRAYTLKISRHPRGKIREPLILIALHSRCVNRPAFIAWTWAESNTCYQRLSGSVKFGFSDKRTTLVHGERAEVTFQLFFPVLTVSHVKQSNVLCSLSRCALYKRSSTSRVTGHYKDTYLRTA